MVNGRTMFITTPMDHLIALDAVTGKVEWSYKPNLSRATLKTICCDEADPVSWSVANWTSGGVTHSAFVLHG